MTIQIKYICVRQIGNYRLDSKDVRVFSVCGCVNISTVSVNVIFVCTCLHMRHLYLPPLHL